jgi:hypothetical protein
VLPTGSLSSVESPTSPHCKMRVLDFPPIASGDVGDVEKARRLLLAEVVREPKD